MAKDPKSTGTEGAAAGNGEAPQLSVLTQYVKDLSFESPGAPLSLRPREKAPAININVNVNANPLAETDYDVNLTLTAIAKDGDDVLFNVELVYGGVFRIVGFPQEHVMPLLFVECPRLIFPFARQIVAECTRNGGFPPLMIDPIDFSKMFQQRIAEEKAKSQVQPN
ncbi:protein-export chaperone SecB [Ahrensia marina]|jgi:preprotein translocase subunit SecB|uniref:Protein-export protein SecB n=1 Tax=Ahrensia marina TaxID=1514904 RepID=A0A0M9GNL7_9HYPH|nr:protein-export chaperone SecB [Ahrensia marina]KPB02127.1 preprotein translocase subunit SecB [Ahrensia marina]